MRPFIDDANQRMHISRVHKLKISDIRRDDPNLYADLKTERAFADFGLDFELVQRDACTSNGKFKDNGQRWLVDRIVATHPRNAQRIGDIDGMYVLWMVKHWNGGRWVTLESFSGVFTDSAPWLVKLFCDDHNFAGFDHPLLKVLPKPEGIDGPEEPLAPNETDSLVGICRLARSLTVNNGEAVDNDILSSLFLDSAMEAEAGDESDGGVDEDDLDQVREREFEEKSLEQQKYEDFVNLLNKKNEYCEEYGGRTWPANLKAERDAWVEKYSMTWKGGLKMKIRMEK